MRALDTYRSHGRTLGARYGRGDLEPHGGNYAAERHGRAAHGHYGDLQEHGKGGDAHPGRRCRATRAGDEEDRRGDDGVRCVRGGLMTWGLLSSSYCAPVAPEAAARREEGQSSHAAEEFKVRRRPTGNRRRTDETGEQRGAHGGGGERERARGMDLGFNGGALGPLIAREGPPDTLAGLCRRGSPAGKKQRWGELATV